MNIQKITGCLITAGLFFCAGSVLTPSQVMAEQKKASVSLPVSVRIVRCVTEDERREMCRSEHICCHLLEENRLAENVAPVLVPVTGGMKGVKRFTEWESLKYREKPKNLE